MMPMGRPGATGTSNNSTCCLRSLLHFNDHKFLIHSFTSFFCSLISIAAGREVASGAAASEAAASGAAASGAEASGKGSAWENAALYFFCVLMWFFGEGLASSIRVFV